MEYKWIVMNKARYTGVMDAVAIAVAKQGKFGFAIA